MPKSYKAIQAKVELKVKRTTITSLNNYLNKINVPLWGTIHLQDLKFHTPKSCQSWARILKMPMP